MDVGCGTGSISRDIAITLGNQGKVIGIDNTEKFILSGKETYNNVPNLDLIYVDLFDYSPDEKFDLIISARTLQWLSNPEQAIVKMKSLLKTGGIISILDYNHEAIEWDPKPPQSMLDFYQCFLTWREDAGMNNHIAADLGVMMKKAGLSDIKVINCNEIYTRDRNDFMSKVGIWSKVAGSTQMVEEGYLNDELRIKAIEEYNEWVKISANSMTMKLNEVRGVNS